MTRITSRDGNVIAADFRPRASLDIAITFDTQILYADEAVCTVRVTARMGDHVLLVAHFMGDPATGAIVQLTNG